MCDLIFALWFLLSPGRAAAMQQHERSSGGQLMLSVLLRCRGERPLLLSTTVLRCARNTFATSCARSLRRIARAPSAAASIGYQDAHEVEA